MLLAGTKKINLKCGILNGAEQDLVKELDNQSKEKVEMERDYFLEASCLGVLQETKGISLKLSELSELVVEENK